MVKLPWIGGLRAACASARIVWCAASGKTVYATSLRRLAEPLIDEIIAEPRLDRGAVRPWGAPPFDGRRFGMVIDTQSDWRHTLGLRRAARGVFISRTAGFLFSSRRPREAAPADIGGRIGALFSLAAGRAVRPTNPWKDDIAALRAAEPILPRGPTYIGLAPGAGGREKRWPLERYIELGRRQLGAGRMPVFFLGPGEADEAAIIASALPGAVLPDTSAGDDAEVSGPRLFIALASRLSAAVANDGGPGHMLAAGGAPLVSLQRSARTAVKYRPVAPRLELIIATDGEMASITVDASAAALDRLARAPEPHIAAPAETA